METETMLEDKLSLMLPGTAVDIDRVRNLEIMLRFIRREIADVLNNSDEDNVFECNANSAE
jgi:hypothetical protein